MANVTDLAFGEIAVHLGFLTQDQVDEAMGEQQGMRVGKTLGEILVELKMITPEQQQRVLQHQARLVKEIKLEDKLRREAHMFARFANQKGMIAAEQIDLAVRLFDLSTDKNRTMAQIMIENGMLTEEQVTEISMSQKHIKMVCANCQQKFTVVTVTQKKEIPCPKCGRMLQASSAFESPSPMHTPRPQLFTQIFRTVKKTQQQAQTKRLKKVRCMVCDHDFQGELDKDNRTVCPACGTSFEVL